MSWHRNGARASATAMMNPKLRSELLNLVPGHLQSQLWPTDSRLASQVKMVNMSCRYMKWYTGLYWIFFLTWWEYAITRLGSFNKSSWGIFWQQSVNYIDFISHQHKLNTLALGKITDILQTTFSNACSWLKLSVFWLKFPWSLLIRVKLAANQHWFN